MTMTLESLMAAPDVAPVLAQYRTILYRLAGAGRSVDDPKDAERLAALARTLGYDVAQVRADHGLMNQLVRLERAFDAEKLARLEAELEPLRKADMLYSISGRTPQEFGFTDEAHYVCTSDRLLADLRSELRAATTDAGQHAIRLKIADVEAESTRLSSLRRVAEEKVIVLLNARDRIATTRARTRRLFPESAD